MWVVKIGGSLRDDPLLPQWLELMTALGGGRVMLVSGGGAFADEARRSQAHWQFDDLSAHNMAVLAMAQMAYLLHALNPALEMATSKADLRRVLHRGRTALWLPLDLLRDAPDAQTHWDVTSDSIALDLARRLNAERLVLIKSCAIDPSASLADLGAAGIVDRSFAPLARNASFPIELVRRDELPRVQSLLLGETRLIN